MERELPKSRVTEPPERNMERDFPKSRAHAKH